MNLWDKITTAGMGARERGDSAGFGPAKAGVSGAVQKSGGAPFPFNLVSSIGGAAGERLRKPFQNSVWVRAATRHVAKPISGVPLEFYLADSDDTEFSDPRLTSFWSAPARGVNSFADFVLASVGWRKLAGECFWLLDDTALVPFPEARTAFPKLVLARPDQMQHVEADGELIGWKYTTNKGRSYLLTTEQTIHLKQWNPYDEFRGLGDFEAARVAAETDAANEKFRRSLAESNGDQGVYVVAKSGLPDDAQKAQIVADLRNKRAKQAQGIFSPVFLGGDIDIKDPQVRQVDLAFLDAGRWDAEKVFVAFGVPPSMSAPAQSYSIGSASDYYRLILDTCIPEGAEICGGIGRVASVQTGKQLTAWLDWDDHPVMREVRKERLASADQLWTKGMPMAEVSDYLGLGLPRYPGDDQGYLPYAVMPVGSPGMSGLSEDPAPTPAPAAEDPANAPTDPVQEMLRSLRCSHGAPQSGPATPTCHKVTAQEAALWRSHMQARRDSIRRYQSAFGRVLHSARAEVLRNLENATTGKRAKLPQDESAAVSTGKTDQTGLLKAVKGLPGAEEDVAETPETVLRAGALDILFDLETFRKGLLTTLRKVGSDTLDTALQQLSAELGRKDPLKYPPERALRALKERENQLTDIADDIWGKMKAVIEDSVNAGEPTEKLAKRLRAEFNEVNDVRGLAIAQTETGIMYGTARQEGMEQAGVSNKQWLTSGGDTVRPEHAAANRQIVGVNDAFNVGGELLRFPGDPNGSPGNIINCRCVSIATEDPLT